ncbi:hypothetical protein PC9H_007877 [Pleurotus ostreatus]|uniref:Uncharacterized protein n=2 Tax=Pleurotus ostreatus TaxID=5322 RepID=A0A067NJN4_PLEO1|nr:uncharacterized protein PC9H_007877 [Pleurotus ostreatus]KAF7428650.1 hypothetical protein PC9H_007877 [Pleurotus ostreatus]KDQ28124.1 hypothetical protein PLEOSDRAFT_1104799 [Pleurotus ostreatus PC15]
MSRGKTLGPLVIANCVNSLSYTLELVMAYVYFRNYQEDKKLMKLAVAALLLVGLVSVVSYMACTYLYTVIHWGNQEYLEVQNTFIIISLLTTGISATVVQSFMTYRYWTFSSNNCIALFLAVLAMLSAICGQFGLLHYYQIQPALFRPKQSGSRNDILVIVQCLSGCGHHRLPRVDA